MKAAPGQGGRCLLNETLGDEESMAVAGIREKSARRETGWGEI